MSFTRDVKPRKGDLLRVQRSLGYYHFGIYIGHGKVVHFSAEKNDSIFDNRNIYIRKAPIEDFYRSDVLEVNIPYSSKFCRLRVAHRAKKQVGKRLFQGKPYDLLTNNCEHFANFCYYGEAVSDQSDEVSKGPMGVISKIGVSVFNSIVRAKSEQAAEEEKEVIDFTEGKSKPKKVKK